MWMCEKQNIDLKQPEVEEDEKAREITSPETKLLENWSDWKDV